MSLDKENQPNIQAAKIAAIKFILARVRADLHSRRCYSRKLKKYEYYKRPKNGGEPEPITDERLLRHITAPEKVEDVHIGVYPLLPGDDKILCAAFDFDNHESALQPGEFAALIRPVIEAARAAGLSPWLVRSGGGAGVHCWFFWDCKPQRAIDVRTLLSDILEQCGFTEGSNGGVQARKVEIFPKQIVATIANPGNLIALPFARASTWLSADLNPLDEPEAPMTSQLTSQPVPVVEDEDNGNEAHESGDAGEGDYDTAIDALSHIKPDCGYDVRQKIGMALKSAFGERGFAPWHEWIRTCEDQTSYKGEREHRYHFNSFRGKLNGKAVTIGTLYWYAEQNGWQRPRKKNSAPKLPPLASAVGLLTSRDEWQGVLSWNDFAKRIILNKSYPGAFDDTSIYPRELAETDITRITVWIQRNGVRIASGVTYEAIQDIAARSSFHPVRDYLRGLKWDGASRADTWLIDHLGAEDTPFNRAVSARWLIAAVARVMKPGFVVKNIPVLEGPQDMYKSTALRVMAVNDEWFTDHLSPLDKKDALEEVQGLWIIEFAEFSNMRHSESERTKVFISTSIDRFRPSYARKPENFPRQWVGVATLNPSANGYLQDATGNVRFWPVRCAVGWEPYRTIDMEKLKAVRDQLWAEATARFGTGEQWWISETPLRIEQAEQAEAREQEDPRESTLRTYLKDCKYVQMPNVLLELGYELNRSDIRRLQTEVGTILCRLKWVRWRAQGETCAPNGKGYYYFPPGVSDHNAYARRLVEDAKAIAAPYQADIPF
jgi:predicted P-loop ATPase